MSNMGYIRNENTFSDLRDVRKNALSPSNDSEKAYLKRIIDECDLLLNEFGFDVPESAIEDAKKGLTTSEPSKISNMGTINF